MSQTSSKTRKVQCSKCDATYRLPADFAGANITCKRCGTRVRAGRRPTTSGSSSASGRSPSRRALAAMGAREKKPLSGLQILSGVITVAVIVAAIIFFN